MAKKFIQAGIKRPGRIKKLAKREGVSTHQAAQKASHSSDPSLRGAGALALRFQKGGDLHSGGSTPLKPGSMKYSMPSDRKANAYVKKSFKADGNYARASVGPVGAGAKGNETSFPLNACGANPGV